MAKGISNSTFISRKRIKRKGIHSKKNISNQKNSIKYKKQYRGQGK